MATGSTQKSYGDVGCDEKVRERWAVTKKLWRGGLRRKRYGEVGCDEKLSLLKWLRCAHFFRIC